MDTSKSSLTSMSNNYLSEDFWSGKESFFLFNPRLPAEDQERALRMKNFALSMSSHSEGHIHLLTSGTTSSQKLIALRKQSFLTAAASVNHRFQLDSKDRWLLTLPLFHVGGLAVFARAFLSKSEVIQMETWNPQDFLKRVQEMQITCASLVPTQIFDLIQLKVSAPKSLRLVFVGGGVLNEKFFEAALALGWPLVVSYGMTETAAMNAASEVGRNSLFPLDHVKMKSDADGVLKLKTSALFDFEVADTLGELQLKPAELDDDGYWTTSDRCEILPDGQLIVLGRAENQVKISGELVHVSRLQKKWNDLASESPWSFQTHLSFSSDERLENKIVLFHELLEDKEVREMSELVERYNASVAPFERIKHIQFVKALPRTDLGKVREGHLRKLHDDEE